MKIKPLKLMIPGPVQPDPAVMQAMGGPVPAHYGPDFRDFYNGTLELLRKVFETDGDIFILNGSGTVGIDAALGSVFSTGDQVLVGDNGFFGERLNWIAESYGLEVIPVKVEWGSALRAEDFERVFAANPGAKGVAMVHLETSTSVYNPIQEIGEVVKKHNGVFIVDAVSSLGGLQMRMDAWNIDVCISASQKCLGAPPGLAPVAVGKRCWEVINQNPKKAHGWYGDLRVWKWYAENWADWHPFPVTMAVNNILALNQSLEQLLEEGIPQRLARYTQLAMRLRNGLREIGMPPYTPDEMLAPVLTAAWGPEGVATGKIVSYMERERQIKISGGLGALKDKVFRIGHMSPVLTNTDIDEVLAALKDYKD